MATQQSLPTPAELEEAEERVGDIFDFVNRLVRRIDDALASDERPTITPAYVGHTFSFWEQVESVTSGLATKVDQLKETLSELNLERSNQEARADV